MARDEPGRLRPAARLVRTAHAAAATLLLCAAQAVHAESYPLPPPGSDFVGEPLEVTAAHDDTLIDVGQRYGLGYEEMVNANPGVDPWLPGEGTLLRLPRRRLLPNAPRKGIVINLPEHRLYYFPPTKAGSEPVVYSYPVSIGKMDWRTPLGTTRVVQKVKDPVWYPPKSVREEHARNGDILPEVVPAGPDNPLGQFALRLGIPGGAYLIHGTNRPAGVGMQVTHGCMRLYPADIEQLFSMVPVNTPVTIVNQPFKYGWHDGALYVEAHPALAEDAVAPPTLGDLMRMVTEAVRADPVPVDWGAAERAWRESSGIPVRVSVAAAAQPE